MNFTFQLILVGSSEWAIHIFPLINNTSYKMLGVYISISFIYLELQTHIPCCILKFSTGYLIASSNLVCLKFLYFFLNPTVPKVLHLSNWLLFTYLSWPKNLSVMLDCSSTISQTSLWALPLKCIPLFTLCTATIRAGAPTMSNVDYCNGLLTSLPAARFVFSPLTPGLFFM